MSTSQKFTVARPGTHYDAESEKLRVFNRGSITVMKAWPPMAWQKTHEHPVWTHIRPSIKVPFNDNLEGYIHHLEAPAEKNGQLLFSFGAPAPVRSERSGYQAWLKWYATMPLEARQLVRDFPHRQWQLLSFIARCGSPATDLAQSNPALAFALANNWVFHKPAVQRPLRSARALLGAGKKQREIMNWLGFPETKAARKVLGKILRCAVSISGLLYLRDAMADPAVFKTMSHLPRLNAGVLRILTAPNLVQRVSFSFLEEVACCRREDRYTDSAYLLLDSLEMISYLPGAVFPPPLRRLDQLERLHDALIVETNQLKRQASKLPFPPPPVKGTDTIIPITNARDLVEEGKTQRNCVSSYLQRVVFHKKTYIYRVLEPERCTLALQQSANHTWQLSELKLARNNQPQKDTWQAVKNWFEAQKGIHADTGGFTRCNPGEAGVDIDFDEDLDYDIPF